VIRYLRLRGAAHFLEPVSQLVKLALQIAALFLDLIDHTTYSKSLFCR
jgi:hypothetical protein